MSNWEDKSSTPGPGHRPITLACVK